MSLAKSKEHLLKRVDARTGAIAMAAHVTGTVVVGVEVGVDGKVTQAVVLSGPELLRFAALDAAKQYEYQPFVIDGVPAVVRTAILFRFGPGQYKSY